MRERKVHQNEAANLSAQASLIALLPFIPFLAGLVLVVIGLNVASGGCAARGLMWIGAGIAVGGFGGVLTVKTPYIAIGGAGGLVLILIGALLQGPLGC